MRAGIILREAWLGLASNKLRAALTMLGVIIGVAAVVALVGVGQGASRQVTSQIQGLGANLIIVTPGREGELYAEDVAELLRRVPTLARGTPSLAIPASLKRGTVTHDLVVEGVGPEYPQVRSFFPALGRFFTEADLEARRRVVVLGQTAAEALFPASFPLGETVLINGEPFLVVGIMEKKGAVFGQDLDDSAFIPVTTAQRLAQASREVGQIYLQARSAAESALAAVHVREIYARKFRNEEAVMVMSQEQLLETVSSASQTLTLMLAAIAGISLVVGGIGIMNIMLVSVAERTREIGLRKAMGATRRLILWQFLAEALLLSLFGGAVGAAGGHACAGLISRLAGWATAVSPGAIALALGFAAAVGLF
ncbi:MAG: ABC transporter permease, partial [Acetobacteraceae bacterium]|nr:ABC transporter permease [Acetobacteraceae bacterium]